MLQGFIDAHVHLNAYARQILDLAAEQDAWMLSINTDVPIFPSLEKQAGLIRTYQSDSADRILYVASFPAEGWQAADWAERTILRIKKEVARGAVGIKIWKNIGMDPDLVYPDGRFLMIDDPKLAPILEYVQSEGLLLITHLGEPRNCWLPLEQMTVDSDREYFRQNPQYHMYRHPEFPSYQDQIRARDRILDRYPQIRFVALHLFSLEWDLNEVDKRLDRYPNTMTDLAERICHVQLQATQDREAVRQFFIKHQDRIIYGTDFIYDGTSPPETAARQLQELWESHWTFFATSEWMEAPQFSGRFRGLDLPPAVLHKIFFENARATYGFPMPESQPASENFWPARH